MQVDLIILSPSQGRSTANAREIVIHEPHRTGLRQRTSRKTVELWSGRRRLSSNMYSGRVESPWEIFNSSSARLRTVRQA